MELIFLVKSLHCGIGGMEAHQKAFIKYFRNNEMYRLWIVTREDKGVQILLNEGDSYKLIGNYVDPKYGFRQLYSVISENPVIFSNDFWWIDLLPIVRESFPNSRICIRSGGNDIEKMPWNIGNLSYVERRILCVETLNNVDKIIVNSRFSQNRFMSYGISKEKIMIIRGGVDDDLCRKVVSNKELLLQNLRERYEIKRPYVFSFACRMVPFKGIRLALDSIIYSTYKNKCHIVFAGDGQLRSEIEKYCFSNGLKTTFLGAIPNEEVLKIIGASHLLFNTSLETKKIFRDHSYIHTETMGRSMIEALLVHTPIIATNVGGVSQLFAENEDIGIMTDCNIYAISEAIERALTHNFSFTIKENYSWNHIFNLYSEIFYSI